MNNNMFNAETLDTFCFRWPAFHCYVLVRVLDHATIALLPFRSRRAFLYFHHAPLPHHPTHFTTTATSRHTRTSIKKRTLRQTSSVSSSKSRIHAMFHPWKQTLALSENASLNSSISPTSSRSNSTKSSSSTTSSSCSSTSNTAVRRPGRIKRKSSSSLGVPPLENHVIQGEAEEEEVPSEVTLEDVLDHVQHHDQWIQASCHVKPSRKDHSGVILETFQNKTIIMLIARSAHDRQIFLNHVRLNSVSLPRLSHQKGVMHKNQISTHKLIEKLEKQCQKQSTEILQLATQTSHAKKQVVYYTDLLNQVDQSMKHLQSSVQELQSMDEHAFRVLYHVQEQIEMVKTRYYHGFRHRLHKLDLWLTENPDIVGAARLRLTLDHVHVSPSWYFWFYLLGILVMGLAIVVLWKKN